MLIKYLALPASRFARCCRHTHTIRRPPSIKSLLQQSKGNKPSVTNIKYQSTNAGVKKKVPIFLGIAAVGGGLVSYYFYTQPSSDAITDSLDSEDLPYIHENLQEDLALLKEFGPIPYLLIGAGTASHHAYRAIRTKDPTAKVLMIGEESFYPYLRPPLSKEMWFDAKPDVGETLSFNQYDGKKRSIFYEVPEFYFTVKDVLESKNGGLAVVRGKKVVKVDPISQVVVLDKGEEIAYKKCLIATGSRPKNLPIFEKESLKRNITLFRNIQDFKKLDKISKKVKSIIIVGGGYLGSELACGLAKRGSTSGLEVIQIYPESGNLGKVLPEYLGKWTAEKVKDLGVKVIPGVTITNVFKSGEKVEMVLSNNQVIKSDHVIVTVGAEPNTELGKTSGLEVDEKHGGFLVNAEMEARKNVWIAGDVSCFYDVLLGRRRVEHHDHALVSGRLAGENMSGQDAKPYTHQSMFWSDIGPDIGFEAIGLVDSALPTVGVFAKTENSQSKVDESNGSKPENVSDVYAPPESGDDYEKGVVFYLKDNIVCGIVLWNVFSQISVARKVINESKSFEDLTEVAKLFKLHSAKN